MDLVFPLELELSAQDISLDRGQGVLGFLSAPDSFPLSSAIKVEVYVPIIPNPINTHPASLLSSVPPQVIEIVPSAGTK